MRTQGFSRTNGFSGNGEAISFFGRADLVNEARKFYGLQPVSGRHVAVPVRADHMQDTVNSAQPVGTAQIEKYGVWNTIRLRIEHGVQCTFAITAIKSLPPDMIGDQFRQPD